ncbi:glycosyl transferase family 39 [Thermocrinis albus DSM 14484]|uniref:Glycosyl transferase family 39 n=1 Tax=Thermocrinis albus (strain DSM 14484 / JCM 11386 / HI 11/12) TaxID=638303 RepID=D3SNU3_THEAH|nr:glycosyltransferase family 39 protein [Thermocrinis albus]ADC88830.1 glycosyl transferase family 39 [Thermocrinis albus DSM 14484]
MRGLLFFLSSITFFRILYVIFYPLDLFPEEAQYWDWSRDLDLSYYSKPPMVAYLNFISRTILGNTEIAVRVWPIFFSFLLSVFTYIFVKRLFDEKTALVASVIPQLSVGFSVNSLLMTTDAPFLFFWSLSVMTIYHASEKNSLRLWLLAGFLAGLAFLSKYPAVFLLPCTLLYLLLYRRNVLLSYKPYVALLPAFFLATPVIYWNMKHGMVSFLHVSTLATKGGGSVWEHILEYLGGQMLILSVIPFFFMLMGWLKGWKNSTTAFLSLYSLPVFLFFSMLSLHKRVEANWPGFAYFTGSILASYHLARSRWLVPSFGLSLFLFLFLHFTPLLDVVGLRKILPPQRDPTKMGVGWSLLGDEVSRLYTGEEMVFSPQYQISAELAFYTKGNPRTFCVNLGRRMNQYDLWREGMKNYVGKDAIFVDLKPIDSRVLSGFEGIIEERSLVVKWRGEEVRRFYIYKLRKFNGHMEESMPEGY